MREGADMSKRIAVIGLYGMSALFHLARLPDTGETVRSNGLIFEPGGKGYNQAISALRAGADVFFATALGDDIYGRDAESVFKQAGLSHHHCFFVQNAATAFAAVAGDDDGHNIVIVEQGACARFTSAMIDALEQEISHCGILILQCEMPEETVRRALELGKSHGLYTILNPAPARKLSPDLLALVDLLTPNWGEAVSIAGVDGEPERVGQALHDMGCGNVIITMGERGAYVWAESGGEHYLQAAYPVACVDSTGAGDNFNGALAARLALGETLKSSVRYAVASSALSVTARGVVGAIPTRKMVEAFLNNNQNECINENSTCR